MDSWSYASEGKDLLFSDDDLSVDAFARNRKAWSGWDKESVKSPGFVDYSFSDILKRPGYGTKTGLGMLSGSEVGIDSTKAVVTSPSCIIASNSSLESDSNHSNSLLESNSQDSCLIDIKLGRFGESKDADSGKIWKEESGLSSVSPTFQVKRARTMSARYQAPCCQVYGCNKDLSSSKDYHKRHKVCEVHSKTPKVIVNGIEQRFCQQCSRFHLLHEFDDGKRSCRKRLAGHNERRRKLQFSALTGTKSLDASLTKRSSFLFPNIFPGGILHPEKYEQANWYKHLKPEEELIYSPQLALPVSNVQLLPKSFLHLHGNGNTGGVSPSATEDCTVFSPASTNHKPSGVFHSSCALSLLSAESQIARHSAGNIVAKPLISQAGHVHHGMGFSEKLLAVGSPNGFYSSGVNSTEANHTGSFVVSGASHAGQLQLEADGFFQDSDFLSGRYCVSPEHESTMDLLQLSSHLQRVEQQRNSAHMRHGNEDSCSFLTTHGI